MLPVSATEIRARVFEGLSIDGLVNTSVVAYIDGNGLYR
jgi:nicotinic acid mononucleotide adenylyltransferase